MIKVDKRNVLNKNVNTNSYTNERSKKKVVKDQRRSARKTPRRQIQASGHTYATVLTDPSRKNRNQRKKVQVNKMIISFSKKIVKAIFLVTVFCFTGKNCYKIYE